MAQQQYAVTLRNLVDNIRRQKPNVDPNNCRDWINQRIRSVLDRRTFWSGTLKAGVLAIPNAYNIGTLTLTNGSTTVVGTDTAWPVSDKVNTIIPNGVRSTGLQTIVPASMVGIDADTVLYVDATGANPEIVPVMETTRVAFRANFAYQHDPNCTITCSSLAGRQIRVTIRYPTFTIRAITSDTGLELDMPWSAETQTSPYNIVGMYYTMAPDIKDILFISELYQMIPIRFHVQQAQLNTMDPQRACSGPPYILADYLPNECGNMRYEVYPVQFSSRQLPYLYVAQWPELKSDGDRPPSFINPNVFLYGALSQAFRTPVVSGSNQPDPYLNENTANYYEQIAERDLQAAIQADEGKAQQSYTYAVSRFWGAGTDWRQSHEWSNLYDGGGGGSQWW